MGECVAVFSPTGCEDADFDWADYQDGAQNWLVGWLVRRNLQRTALGPRIEVYRLGSADSPVD